MNVRTYIYWEKGSGSESVSQEGVKALSLGREETAISGWPKGENGSCGAEAAGGEWQLSSVQGVVHTKLVNVQQCGHGALTWLRRSFRVSQRNLNVVDESVYG